MNTDVHWHWQPNGIGNVRMGDCTITHPVMLGFDVPQSHPWHKVKSTKGIVQPKRTVTQHLEAWELFR